MKVEYDGKEYLFKFFDKDGTGGYSDVKWEGHKWMPEVEKVIK